MVTAMRYLALLLALVVACSSAPAPTRCTPGASVACVCPGVGTGAQVCAADGSSYGACACGVDAGGDTSVTPGADVASGTDVAVAVVDAPALDAGGAEDRPTAVDAVAVVDAGPVMLCGDASVNVVEGTYLSTGPNGGRFTNCGACGMACPMGNTCTVGKCVASPDAGIAPVLIAITATPPSPAETWVYFAADATNLKWPDTESSFSPPGANMTLTAKQICGHAVPQNGDLKNKIVGLEFTARAWDVDGGAVTDRTSWYGFNGNPSQDTIVVTVAGKLVKEIGRAHV